jgi:hypothetical protein
LPEVESTTWAESTSLFVVSSDNGETSPQLASVVFWLTFPLGGTVTLGQSSVRSSHVTSGVPTVRVTRSTITRWIDLPASAPGGVAAELFKSIFTWLLVDLFRMLTFPDVKGVPSVEELLGAHAPTPPTLVMADVHWSIAWTKAVL